MTDATVCGRCDKSVEWHKLSPGRALCGITRRKMFSYPPGGLMPPLQEGEVVEWVPTSAFTDDEIAEAIEAVKGRGRRRAPNGDQLGLPLED